VEQFDDLVAAFVLVAIDQFVDFNLLLVGKLVVYHGGDAGEVSFSIGL